MIDAYVSLVMDAVDEFFRDWLLDTDCGRMLGEARSCLS